MADVKISQLTHIPSITDADVMLISDIETLVSYKMDLSNLASYTSTALSSGSNLDTLFAGIKTVDGSGSGLDADLLDGQNGSYYLDWNNATNKPDPVLTLNGDVSGTATFTNLANATLTVTVSDDSHNHVIANVDGLQSALDSKASLASPTFTGVPTAPTATAGTSNTQLATTAFVSTAVSNLVDTAPSTLDTLNELAAALGDNPNFATTVTNSLATKLPLAGGEMTGNITFSSTQTVDGRDLSVDGSKLDGIESGATADQTAAEILTAIKTVDGSGSGLDADLWDGNQFASYLNQAVLTTSSPTFSGLTLNGSGGTLTTLFSAADGTTKEDFLGGFVSEDRAFRMLSERQGGSRYYWFTFNQDYDGTTHTQGNWGGSSAIKFAGSTTQFFADYQVTGGSQDSISPTLSMSILPTGVEIENDLSIGGNISVTGTVDGRDIATDGSKLDGIESGATADQTAAEILTAIKTVDGSGSGLDADLLDGIHASSLLRSDVSDQAAVIEFQGGVTYTPPAGSGSDTATDVGIALTSGNRLVGAYNGYIRNLLEWNSSNDIVIGQASTALITGINLLPGGSGDAKVNGNKIWHAGNDGSGSGLDADTVDGIQASSFLRSDANDTTSGNITINNTQPAFYFSETDTTTNARLILATGNFYIQAGAAGSGNSTSSGNIRFTGYNGTNVNDFSVRYGGTYNTIWHAGNDGSGSGLDADLWDGNQFADYLDQSVKTTSNPAWPSATLTGGLTLGTSITHQGDADTSIGFTTNQIVLQAGGVDALTANSTQLLSPLPLTVGNGTDQDYDLIVVNSSKAAKLYWDESATKIATNWGFYAAGDVRFNSYATIKTSLGVGPTVSVPPTEALEVDGNISVTGTVDGRDIATDGSTLDTLNSTALTTSTTFGGDVSGTYNAIVVANDSHTHDGRYYTESEINTKLTNGTVNKLNNQTQNQTGNFHMFVNDGGGNIGMRWNSTPGGTNTLVENGIAYELEIGNDSATGDFNILKGSTATNTAGETITWTRAFKIEGSDSELYAYDNKIWHAGNDGSGSGLDADTLDGLQASSLLRSDTNDSFTGTITNSGELHSFYNNNAPGTTLRLGRSTEQYMTFHGGSSGNYMTSVSTSSNPKYNIKFGISVDSGATLASNYTLEGSSGAIWHTGNDGSGSGLDADTLDGLQATDFVRINSTSGNSNDYLHISRNSTNATLYVNNISTGDIARFFKGSASSSTSGTNQVTIANDGSITATGDINTTSDARVKDNIEIIENAVDKVKQIRGVTFNRTDKEDAEKRYAGVIAQEVQKVLPEVIGGDEDNLTVAYGNMIGLLIEAIKEQQKQIEELKGMIQ